MMSTYLIKHREETDLFEVDLSRRLTAGDSIASVQSVKVSRNRGLDWEDRTDEFVDAGETSVLNNRIVRFTLMGSDPASRPQRVGEYLVNIRVSTTQGRILVATVPLFIIRAGT
jgi:hypothetical protein